MNEKLKKLLARKAEIIKELRAILDGADAEKRDITEDEETRYTELEAELGTVETEIKAAEKAEKRKADLESRESDMRQPANNIPVPAHNVTITRDEEEIQSVTHILYLMRFNPNHRALEELREQSMGVGVEGGIMVPTQFRPGLLSYSPQEAVFRPRCQVIEVGSPPDAEVTMPALDQTAAQNIYGGVVLDWISEGKAKPETDMRIREITLRPHEAAGHIVVTDKLLRNWTAAQSTIENQMRLAMIGGEETAFYSGDGVGKPQGILHSPARIDYARATANQIAFADISGMYARSTSVRMGGSPIWLASQTVIPQLATIQDAASQYIWVQNAATGIPPSLFGIPVFFHDRSVALGNRGDLCLLDLRYYLIKDGSGPFVAASPHVRFIENKTVIKIFWNVDGQPWLSEPIPLEGSTTNTVSPFVILN